MIHLSFTALAIAFIAGFSFVAANGHQAAIPCQVKRSPRPTPPKKGMPSTSHPADGQEYIINVWSNYILEIELGTPSQAIYVELDTGSSDTWVLASNNSFCEDLDNECQQFGLFDSSQSSSLAFLNSDFNITYADGTFSMGDFVTDTVSFAGLELSNYTTGIGYESTVNCGFMGLGFPGLELTNFVVSPPYTYTNILPALKDAGLINRAAFSLYLNGMDSENGTILFGGIDESKVEGELFTLPIINSKTKYDVPIPIEYTIQIDGIKLGNKPIMSTPQACLMDSGYTYAAFSSDALNASLDFFSAVPDDIYGYTRSCEFDKANEIFTFQFPDGHDLVIPASNFLLPITDTECAVGIMDSGSTDRMVFGDPILRGAYVVYDQEAYEISLGQARINETESNIQVIQKLEHPVTPTATLQSAPTCQAPGRE